MRPGPFDDGNDLLSALVDLSLNQTVASPPFRTNRGWGAPTTAREKKHAQPCHRQTFGWVVAVVQRYNGFEDEELGF